MPYFYLDELDNPANAISYDVTARPPPADAATATVKRGALDGATIYQDANLLRAGRGRFQLDKTQLRVSDSPVFIEFKFTKGATERVSHKAIVLADPQPGTLTVPRVANLGQQVELRVATWSAVTFETPGTESPRREANARRISQDVKDSVKWKVDGEDLSETGERVNLTIEEKHLGKELAVEAYVGTPSGRAVGTIKVYKIVSLDPADGAVKKWFVNLPPAEGEPRGRDVDIKATVQPVASGVTVYFFLTDNTGTRTISDPELSTNVKAKLSRASATTGRDGTATVKLTLSSYGGDKQRVYASLKRDAADGDAGNVQTCEFEVWRKLNFELEVMSGLSDAGATDAAKEQWRSLFLEAEQVGTNSTPDLRVITKSEVDRGSWQHGFRMEDKPPAYLQLCYVQDISLGNQQQSMTWNVQQLQEGQFNENFTQELDGYVIDSGNWFVSCRWRVGSRSGTLQKDTHVTLDLGVGGTGDYAGKVIDRITIQNLPDALRTPSANGSIALTIRHMSILAGYNKGDTAVVAVGIAARKRLAAGDTRNHLLCCALHESGHSLGLASTSTARRPSQNLVRSGPTYSQNGNHCHENGDTCIMYHVIPSSSPISTPAFCNYCADALRARHIPRPGTLNPF